MPPNSSDFLDSDFDTKIRNAVPESGGKLSRERNKYTCSHDGCNLTFKRMDNLDRHEYTHTGVKKYICDHTNCSKRYAILTHLKRHTKRFHEKMFPPKNINCKVEDCQQKFRSQYDMEKHFHYVHENAKVYICSTCSEKFRQKLQLRRHMVKQHTGIYPFKCEQCDKGFLLEKQLERHVCKSKKYVCSSCSQEFKKWSELVTHRRSKACIWHKCDVCERKFKEQARLKAHKECHKPDEDRDVFSCTWEGCKKFYFYLKNLNTHVKAVHENKKFKCTVDGCEKVLFSKQSLKRHIHRIHERPSNISKSVVTQKNRARRKDYGTKRISTASSLAGIILEPQVEKLVMEGKGSEINLSEEGLLLPGTADIGSHSKELPQRVRLEIQNF